MEEEKKCLLGFLWDCFGMRWKDEGIKSSWQINTDLRKIKAAWLLFFQPFLQFLDDLVVKTAALSDPFESTHIVCWHNCPGCHDKVCHSAHHKESTSSRHKCVTSERFNGFGNVWEETTKLRKHYNWWSGCGLWAQLLIHKKKLAESHERESITL